MPEERHQFQLLFGTSIVIPLNFTNVTRSTKRGRKGQALDGVCSRQEPSKNNKKEMEIKKSAREEQRKKTKRARTPRRGSKKAICGVGMLKKKKGENHRETNLSEQFSVTNGQIGDSEGRSRGRGGHVIEPCRRVGMLNHPSKRDKTSPASQF